MPNSKTSHKAATHVKKTYKKHAVDQARLVSIEALTKVRQNNAFANLVLPTLIKKAHLNRRDASFATALTYGTLRLQGRYDAIISHCVDRPLAKLDGIVLDLLRLGAHQLLGMRVATHGAVSATVDLAAYVAPRGAGGLVNAVLRRVSEKQLDTWLAQIQAEAPDDIAALAALHSHPEWIVKALKQALIKNNRDPKELVDLLAADNSDPQVVLCARPGLVSNHHLIKEIESTQNQAKLGQLSPYAVVMSGGDPGQLPAVRSAQAGVEDEGSQLAALILSEAPLEGRDERWLDLCAGPGGKAALLAARASARKAQLVANEVSAHRVQLLRASLHAISADVVQVQCGDGCELGKSQPGYYDRVLVDAPCSGLGSLRRRPEARWRRRSQDVPQLAELQRKLLTSALQAVRKGGLVAYVTCSPHVLETQFVVQDVIKKFAHHSGKIEIVHAGNQATKIAPIPPQGADQAMLQLWPHLDGCDAMFCALLRRVA